MFELMIFLCDELAVLWGTGYPSGITTHAGAGMCKLFYLSAYTGNPIGKVLSDTLQPYGCRMSIPIR